MTIGKLHFSGQAISPAVEAPYSPQEIFLIKVIFLLAQ
jgi:hypothetical protein